MIHGSYGTLGVISRLKFRLIPAKLFVKLTYRRYHDFKSFLAALREHCDITTGEFDFVDGIVHAPDHLTLCLGKFVDEAPYLGRDWSAVFEEQTFRHDGVKTLISRNHYDRARFFEIHDEARYTAAKQRLDPHALFHRGVFEKLHRVE